MSCRFSYSEGFATQKKKHVTNISSLKDRAIIEEKAVKDANEAANDRLKWKFTFQQDIDP